MNRSAFQRLRGFRKVPRRFILIATVTSVAAADVLNHEQWPLWAIGLAVVAPWIPFIAIEIAWTFRHYNWLALFYLLVITQLGHLGEHVAQEYQLHVLQWPASQAHGVFGSLDIEWVHFIWNLWVIAAVLVLMCFFPRNPWLWITAVLAGWHEIEHSFILTVYLRSGMVGTPGLLAAGGAIGGGLPLSRPDLHFLYNLIETLPLVVAFGYQLRRTYEAWLGRAFPLARTELLVLATDRSKILHFTAGQTVLRGGQIADRLYVILRGEVGPVPEGKPDRLGDQFPLGAAQTIGKRGFLNQTPSAVSWQAKTAVDLLAIDQEAARQLLQRPPPTDNALVQALPQQKNTFAPIKWKAKSLATGRRQLVMLALALVGVAVTYVTFVPLNATSNTGLVWHPPDVSVRLFSANGKTSVTEGRPFRFLASIHNHSTDATQLYVKFQLLSVEGGRPPVTFDSWLGLIPGSMTVTVPGQVTPSRWFANPGVYQIVGLMGSVVATPPLRFTELGSTVPVPKFLDATQVAGVSTVLPAGGSCGLLAAGAAWGDVDNTGYPDLYVPSLTGPAHLWINDGHGHFTDQARLRGVDNAGGRGIGAVFVDYDNSGHQSLYVLNAGGPNRLYHNDGHGYFNDVAVQAGVANVGGFATSAAWGDYDNDGYLDLYVTNYGTCPNGDLTSLVYQTGRLFHNERNGTFSDQTGLLRQSNPRSTMGAGFQAAWFDYNGTGRLSLYVANDFVGPSPQRNHLWRNDGRGKDSRWVFTDVSSKSGTNLAISAMGIAIGDYNRHLHLDLALSNMGPNKLLRNNGDGTFTDVTDAAGINRPMPHLGEEMPVTWAMGFYDLNLDGWEDLYVAAGSLGDQGYYQEFQTNQVFVNAGDGTFLDLSAASQADDDGFSRGVAFADYDRDGRMDLYVVNQNGSPRLYRNVTPYDGRHWLEVQTVGTLSNRDGCGARVIVSIGGHRLLRQVFCGSTGLASGSDRVLHFGLGKVSKIDQMDILWPSGIREIVHNIGVDQMLTVTEPG